jgi:curved DNA-binding protein CbpA
MKLESTYFDKIRVKRQRRPAEKPKTRACDAGNCKAVGEFRAPKGREAEGEFFWFCLDHVRAYNKSYNYFSGMNDGDIQSYQKDSSVGHRPTWRMGANASGDDVPPPTGRTKTGWTGKADDPFRLFPGGFRPQKPDAGPRRTVRNMERKSLRTLGLDATASAQDVKDRYKQLVKRHHPDANGGDRSLEDKLRDIIQAYNYLKSVGFC